jgi:hypothetical protein
VLDERALQGDNWTLTESRGRIILDKMTAFGKPLWEYINHKVYFGVKTGYDKAFVISQSTRERLISSDSKNAELVKSYVIGDDVRKYHINFRERYLVVIPKGWTRMKMQSETEAATVTEEDAWKWLQENYPGIAGYLQPNKVEAKKRQDMGEFWWELRACAYYSEFGKPKIIYPDIAKESRFAFDDTGCYPAATNFIIHIDDCYLLAILNSRLAFFALKMLCPVLGDPAKGGRLRLKTVYTRQLPIRWINFANPAEKSAHDEIVKMVEEMLALQKQRQQAEAGKEDARFALQKRIQALDKEIDARVYRLYGLTEEEIKIVEGAG